VWLFISSGDKWKRNFPTPVDVAFPEEKVGSVGPGGVTIRPKTIGSKGERRRGLVESPGGRSHFNQSESEQYRKMSSHSAAKRAFNLERARCRTRFTFFARTGNARRREGRESRAAGGERGASRGTG
jgi:hypothetical protein